MDIQQSWLNIPTSRFERDRIEFLYLVYHLSQTPLFKRLPSYPSVEHSNIGKHFRYGDSCVEKGWIIKSGSNNIPLALRWKLTLLGEEKASRFEAKYRLDLRLVKIGNGVYFHSINWRGFERQMTLRDAIDSGFSIERWLNDLSKPLTKAGDTNSAESKISRLDHPNDKKIIAAIEDEDKRWARMAKHYGGILGKKLHPASMKIWEAIGNQKDIGKTHSKIQEQLNLPESTFKYHWRMMTGSGFYSTD